MGKVAKFALPIAALGIGAAIGPSLLGGAVASGPATFGTGLMYGPTAGAVTSGFSWGSVFSGAKSLFTSKNLGLLSGAGNMLGNYQSMQMTKYGYKMQEMQLAEERRLRGMQQKLDEADAMRESYRGKQRAMAKAAAQGRDLGNDRSFMAYLDAEDRALQSELDNIRVNASSANRVSGMQIAGLRAKSSSATRSSVIKIGRGFFDTASDYRKL